MKKQSKIPFDENTADMIIEKFGLDPKTKKVWKTRGHIPGAYLEESGVDTAPTLTDRDPVRQRLVEILQRPEIAASKFRAGQKYADVARGKSSLTEAEAISMEGELAEIRNKIAKALAAPTIQNLTAVLKDVRLHPTKLMEAKIYSKITDLRGRTALTAAEMDYIRLRLIVLRAIVKI